MISIYKDIDEDGDKRRWRRRRKNRMRRGLISNAVDGSG